MNFVCVFYVAVAPQCILIKLEFNKQTHLIQKYLLLLSSCSGFQKSPVGRYLVNLKGPVLYLVGPYSISGRVLVLPIQGVGTSNITLGECAFCGYLCVVNFTVFFNNNKIFV